MHAKWFDSEVKTGTCLYHIVEISRTSTLNQPQLQQYYWVAVEHKFVRTIKLANMEQTEQSAELWLLWPLTADLSDWTSAISGIFIYRICSFELNLVRSVNMSQIKFKDEIILLTEMELK